MEDLNYLTEELKAISKSLANSAENSPEETAPPQLSSQTEKLSKIASFLLEQSVNMTLGKEAVEKSTELEQENFMLRRFLGKSQGASF